MNTTYPLQFHFHIGTLNNDFTLTDSNDKTLAYARQKLFRLKEKVNIFSDKSKNELMYTIEATKWLDFNTAYIFKDKNEQEFGKVCRKGWKSLWKATYEVFDDANKQQYSISEKNPFVKFIDGIIGEIPVLGFFTGYFLNPTYLIKRMDDSIAGELKKDPSFFGRKFSLHNQGNINLNEEKILFPAITMMILLERARG